MPRLSQEKVMEIRQSADIVEIISEYIPLTQKGRNYFGICPFHQDHSPSMSVSREKQLFKCFSCGAAGNVFKFVSDFENISYFEAIGKVASKVGIDVDIGKSIPKVEKYTSEYETMNLANLYFKNNLNTTTGEKAKEYLMNRGLTEETITEFDIGLSLEKNDLFEFLKKKKIKESLMTSLGLVNQNGLEFQDVFKNRIIFPIHDAVGHVIGFIGRVYKDNMNPKYLNSRETQIFRKGNILFNYHRAKEEVRFKKYLILVEGNMDAIRLYSSGIKNAVALQGTSLTPDHIKLIQKLRVPVVLMLDNDTAGENATLLNGGLLDQAGIKVEVVRLSGEKDPDEYILKNGVEAMEENLSHPISFLEFKLQTLKKNKNLNDSRELADYVKGVLKTLEGQDAITVDVTLNKLVKDYNLSYDVLKQEMTESQKEILPSTALASEPKKERKSRYEVSAEHILYYMMNDNKYIQMYKTSLGFFGEALYRGIANEILYYYENHRNIYLADFLDYAEDSPLKEEIYALIKGIKNDELDETSMRDYIYIVKENRFSSQLKELKKEQKETNDMLKKEEIAKKIVELKKKIQEMKKERSV